MNQHRLSAKQHASFLAESRKDPYTHEPLRDGDLVVFCAVCSSAFLASSWEAVGRRHCGQSSTLSHVPSGIQVERLGKKTSSGQQEYIPQSPALSWRWVSAIALAVIVACLAAAVYLDRQHDVRKPTAETKGPPTDPLTGSHGQNPSQSMNSVELTTSFVEIESNEDESGQTPFVEDGEVDAELGDEDEELRLLIAELEAAQRDKDGYAEEEVARRILALDYDNPAARAVRQAEFDRLAEETKGLVPKEDEAQVERIWQRFRESWGESPDASVEEQQAIASIRKAKSVRLLAEVLEGLEFVHIPNRPFDMGCTVGDSDCEKSELPRVRRMKVPADFFLAADETTNAVYLKCVEARECQPPSNEADLYRSARANYPVVWVSWTDAQDFCEWIGGRLPSEAEWELAARGLLVGSRYPNMNNISHEDANFLGEGGRDRWEQASPVGVFPPNRHGLHDMAGNVREWVSSSYITYDSPLGEGRDNLKMIRGGAWNQDAVDLRVSARQWAGPTGRSDNLGFRCAKDDP